MIEQTTIYRNFQICDEFGCVPGSFSQVVDSRQQKR